MSHYKILGVSKDATRAAVRAAYLQKVKKFHPDVNQSPQAEKIFKAVQDAYNILSDDARRKELDATSRDEHSEGKNNSRGGRSQTFSNRFKGNVYDPEKEKADFAREFFEQAEALRREMEAHESLMDSLKSNIYRLFWRSIPALLILSTLFVIYRRSQHSPFWDDPKILHDMYGRAYKTDRFGRRERTPQWDDRGKLAQWESSKNSTLTDSFYRESSESSLPLFKFRDMEEVSATRRGISDLSGGANIGASSKL